VRKFENNSKDPFLAKYPDAKDEFAEAAPVFFWKDVIE
jgi:hypothetical protein